MRYNRSIAIAQDDRGVGCAARKRNDLHFVAHVRNINWPSSFPLVQGGFGRGLMGKTVMGAKVTLTEVHITATRAHSAPYKILSYRKV